MKEYVLGFVFDLYQGKVLLIKKKKPEWQKGFLNGIGGSIEDGENLYDAMARECEEEAGALVPPSFWTLFCTMDGKDCPDGDWAVHCLYHTITNPDNRVHFYSAEDQVVMWYHLETINTIQWDLLGNIPWLVGMALDHLKNTNFKPVTVEYKGGFSLPLNLFND